MSYRRTLYMTDEEERHLLQLSSTSGTAVNSIIRIALRRLFGLPVPSWANDLETTRQEREK